MRGIDKIRNMSINQLAKFLAESGAETGPDFCTLFCEQKEKEDPDCAACRFCGENGDLNAWKAWLGKEAE